VVSFFWQCLGTCWIIPHDCNQIRFCYETKQINVEGFFKFLFTYCKQRFYVCEGGLVIWCFFPGSPPTVEFLHETKSVTVDLTTDLNVDFVKDGQSVDKGWEFWKYLSILASQGINYSGVLLFDQVLLFSF
jgi:hypothetical protein